MIVSITWSVWNQDWALMYIMIIKWRYHLTDGTEIHNVFNDFMRKINDPRTLNGLTSVTSNTTSYTADTVSLKVVSLFMWVP